MNEACLNLRERMSAQQRVGNSPLWSWITCGAAGAVPGIDRTQLQLEATPAEGTSYRLALLDTQLPWDHHGLRDSGTPFYTNSSQLPVNYG